MTISIDNKHIGFAHSKSFSLQESVQYAQDAIVSKIISKKDTGNVTLFAFDKGQFLSEHTAPFDALVQIVEGTARISIQKEEHTVSVGEMIIMPANIPHAVYAESRMKMMLIMIKS
jgi:quercetin dioxygenase-like cupin family protein